MKVSIGKFYTEVTGRQTKRSVAIPALKRWGVPCDELKFRGEQVDIEFLEPARKIHAIEAAAMAERVAARVPRRLREPGRLLRAAEAEPSSSSPLIEAVAANTRALRNVETALMLLAERLTPSIARVLEDHDAKVRANGDARVPRRTP